MGEKKRRLAQGAATTGTAPLARALSALQGLHAGQRDPAEQAFAVLAADPPDDADALNAIAVLGLQLGHERASAKLLADAVARAPGRADIRCHRAIALRRLGDPDQATAELEAAIALDPALPEAHSNLGLLRLDLGDFDGARECFERALALRSHLPDALNGLGSAMLALGDAAGATKQLEHAVALDQRFHEALYNLSRAHLQRASGGTGGAPGDNPEHAARALDAILAALRIAGDRPAYWTQFEACVANLDLRHPVPAPLSDALFRALRHPAVDPARLVRPIAGIVKSYPGAASIAAERAPDVRSAGAIADRFRGEARFMLGNPLLVRLLEETVVPDALVQRVATFARSASLAERTSAQPWLPLDSLVAVAHQHFLTEYVNDATPDEHAHVNALVGAIATRRGKAETVALADYALYACYRPLSTLADADRVAAELEGSPLHSLVRRQVIEPREETRLRPAIAALTPVVGSVSDAVRRQYEANPYPRWQRMRAEAPAPSLAVYLRRRFPHADLAGIAESGARILIAGCGTGRHPVQTAQRFPSARILAIDLSRASLAFAMRKTREAGLSNVEYAQADILALGGLAERFDAIECSGVLHHLEDPRFGWRILLSLLKPGGVMRIGLYSAIARRHVQHARAFAAAHSFDASPEGIRAFRAAVLARGDDPLLARVARGEDFYSESGCRDLVFHVQEHAFTLPAIAEHLRDLELAFLGFDLPDPAIAASYRARFPDDPAMLDFAHWARFEDERPDTFAAMYQFWVRAAAA